MNSTFVELCRKGDLNEIIPFYHSHESLQRYPWHELFHLLCRIGRLSVAQWLITVTDIETKQTQFEEWMVQGPLVSACLFGHCHIVEWLFQLFPNEIESVENGLNLPFDRACSHGHLKVVQFLLQKQPNIFGSQPARWYKLFHEACSNNHFHVVRYLLEDISIPLDICLEDNLTFCRCCFNGNLELVQYLFQKRPDMNIFARECLAFAWAAENNHYHVFKWLLQHLSLGHDVHVFQHVFQLVCQKRIRFEIIFIMLEYFQTQQLLKDSNRSQVILFQHNLIRRTYDLFGSVLAQYVVSMLPPCVCTINEFGMTIYPRKESRWQRRKYLVWIMSSQSHKMDTLMTSTQNGVMELLRQLPEDISKKIIREYF